MVTLSKRLQAIAGMLPQGCRLADIGSDHALLPVYAVEQGIAVGCIAGELNPGPLRSAEKQVREAGLSERISVRRGDGLEVLNPGEADTVVIAGMGGHLITRILTNGPRPLAAVDTLVLQPNVGEDAVRRWLTANDWYLQNERIVEEDGVFYEILVAVRHPEASRLNRALFAPQRVCGTELDERWLYRLGPRLLQEGSAEFIAKWLQEIDKLEMIWRQMAQSRTEEAARKREALRRDIDCLREVVHCLQKAKPSFN